MALPEWKKWWRQHTREHCECAWATCFGVSLVIHMHLRSERSPTACLGCFGLQSNDDRTGLQPRIIFVTLFCSVVIVQCELDTLYLFYVPVQQKRHFEKETKKIKDNNGHRHYPFGGVDSNLCEWRERNSRHLAFHVTHLAGIML